MELYHASKEIVQYPEIRKAKYTKDFSWGFYCIMQKRKTHNYDIVEGPMANDTVWNYVNDFLAGRINRKITGLNIILLAVMIVTMKFFYYIQIQKTNHLTGNKMSCIFTGILLQLEYASANK